MTLRYAEAVRHAAHPPRPGRLMTRPRCAWPAPGSCPPRHRWRQP